MKFDLARFDALVDEGWLSRQKHPTLDLLIYNYTHLCQIERHWTAETLLCRGLIVDLTGNVVARPFPKFFNVEELQPLAPEDSPYHFPSGDFDVFEKIDGSLGILYFDVDKPCLATRGSFTSEQAMRGTEILRREHLPHGQKLFDCLRESGATMLFEIIYPQNRIVVDYNGVERVVFLAAIDNETGLDDHYNEGFAGVLFGSTPSTVNASFDSLKNNPIPNSEGFVIRWHGSNRRAKVKFDEYVRLHRIMTGVNERRVWEVMSTDGNLSGFLTNVPDEFYKYVNDIKERLLADYDVIAKCAKREADAALTFPTRKEQAAYINENAANPGVTFAMLDGKNHADAIWRLLRPKPTKPFRIDINES